MRHRIGTPEIVRLLRNVLRDIRDEVRREGVTTGRRWTRPTRRCPDWCASDHSCTAQHGYPSGEHRSPPTTWRPDWGRVIATRVAAVDRRPQVELRIRVNIDGINEEHAMAQAIHLPLITMDAIEALLAELLLSYGEQPIGTIPQALPHIPRRVIDGATVSAGGSR